MAKGVRSVNNKNKKVKISSTELVENNDTQPSENSQSENESGDEEESLGEEISDDEMDLDQVSSDDAEPESDEGEDEKSSADDEDDEDDDFPLTRIKKSSKSKHDDGSEAFSSAMTAILSSHLKAYDRADPIMARNKKILKKNEQDKLDLKAKKALLAEKKRMLSKNRQQDIIPLEASQITKTLEHERKLRKIAQKGVVKLFNVIMSTQVRTDKEVNEKFGNPKAVTNLSDKKKLISEVSKETFLDLVKAAGADDE